MDQLYHYGIKGMRWGVRRTPEELGHSPVPKGVRVKANGEISISKGSSLQRLVRKDAPAMKGITYASFLEYDNAKYIRYIGGKGPFGGGRDKILSLRAKESLKSPSVDEACQIMVRELIRNKEFRETFTNAFGYKISDKEFQKMQKDPTGSVSRLWYHELNIAMTFSAEFDPSIPFVQKTFKNALLESGYNMLRDENDFFNNVSKAPVIIFNPESSLEVVSMSMITDEIRKKSKATVNEYKQLGRKWVEELVYE